MKICKHCECINGDGATRCENCNRPLDKCREIRKEEIVEEDRRIIRRKRRGRRVFACVSLVVFVALYIVAVVKAAGGSNLSADMESEDKIYYVLGWVFAPACFAIWFLSVVIPEKLYKAHYDADSFLTRIDLFFEGYDVDRRDLQPNFIFDIKYKIGLTVCYLFSFLLVIFYLAAS